MLVLALAKGLLDAGMRSQVHLEAFVQKVVKGRLAAIGLVAGNYSTHFLRIGGTVSKQFFEYYVVLMCVVGPVSEPERTIYKNKLEH